MNTITNHDAALRPPCALARPGQSSQKNSFEIRTIRWAKENRNDEPSARSKNDFFKIIWIAKGTGNHIIDMDKQEMKAGTIYCVTPGKMHHFGSAENAEGYILSFTSEFIGMHETTAGNESFAGLFHSFLDHPIISVDVQTAMELNETAEKMMREFDNFNLLRSEILRGLLKVFLIYVNRLHGQSVLPVSNARNRSIAGRFFALLEKNYTTHKMVAEYAGELSVTPNYLNEIVKRVSGFPASYHIQQRIILEAKRKAAYVNMSMKEIAYYLGFDDISHFSKFFKKGSGTNFTDFKKEITQQFSFL